MGHGMVAALGAVALMTVAARADAREDYLARLAAAVRAGYAEALAARTPRLVPPVPVPVRWKAIRLGSLDLGAPLVALTGADLDADGRGELYAVTTRDVIAIGMAGGKLAELGRVAFAGELAVPAPREAVGTAVVDGAELVAAVSSRARELRVGWRDHALVARPGEPGFLVCPGERLALAPGRNHFGDPATPLYGVRCRADLVGPAGHPLRVRGALTGTTLEVTIDQCAAGGGACRPIARHAYADYGVVFELADVERDGTPEVIVTGAGAPGDPDAVKVITLGGDDRAGRFRTSWRGGVAGLAVTDGDGDGIAEIVAAVRLVGSTRVDLWRLD